MLRRGKMTHALVPASGDCNCRRSVDVAMKRLSRDALLWVIAVTVIVVGGTAVWSMLAARAGASRLLDRGPSVPVPTAADAAAAPLTAEGVRITVKQRSSAWLPGGSLKLHLDDITGGQVLVSVTDSEGRVIVGPKSVTQGDVFRVGEMNVQVIRLLNMLTSTSDFGEFEVKPGSAAPTRSVP
jgi:hypothetical protein